MNHERISSAVDIIIERQSRLLLIRRKNDPFQGKLALPGGFVSHGETVEQAALREAKEEAGLKVVLKEILGVYSSPDRDPRGHVATTVFIADSSSGNPSAGDDASEAKFFSIVDLDFSQMAFDHAKILKDYMRWKRKGNGTFWSSKEWAKL